MKRRIETLDFLKCVFIVLMVIFHLAYIGDKYPAAKTFVYTFHMSGFLLLSGFLTRVDREPRRFFRGLWWIFVPYAVMESGYVLLSAVLPVREPVASLTVGVWLHKLVVAPLGPYWYLHTLMLCQLAGYVVFRVAPRRRLTAARMALLGALFYAASRVLPTFGWADAFYFWCGMLLARLSVRFESAFHPSVVSLPLWLVLAFVPACHDRGTPGGMAVTWLTVSGLLYLFGRLPVSAPALRLSLFVGRNTLPVLLFSPLFTLLFKFLVPAFAFDATGLLFLLVATAGTLCGSLGIAFLLDRLHLSRWFFGRPQVLS